MRTRLLAAPLFLLLFVLLLLVPAALPAADLSGPRNLLLNPELGFHSFANSRSATAASYRSGSVACWNEDTYGEAEAYRGPRVPGFRTRIPVDGAVVIHPGKRFYQFSLLSEMGLDHGDRVSLSVFGHQKEPDSLETAIHLMRLDSATGDWSPADYGQSDKRRFPRHSRGELVRGPSYTARSGAAPDFETKIENAEVVGAFTEDADHSTDQPNTIGIQVEFVNRSASADVWIYSPCLSRSAVALNQLPPARSLPNYYRGIPRTMQKLWRGEPLHMIVMGSSIDRGSANPPQYLYDEDPKSPTYKQPLTGTDFEGKRVGHPEWDDYIAWWQHYFMYGGRLRRALMEKFDYPIDRLLLNTMACDGSSISESHSALAEYASLSQPPNPGGNGHRAGKSWKELYPALFARPEGPRPDLVIFGSGANEKVDGADEIALFEGAIRWYQRHYPDTEMIFCMWQNREGYTPNTGHLAELALRYQIPVIDLGRTLNLTTRYCNSYALVPKDGHPQAAGHYLWAKQLERAFDAADPVEAGVAQLQLPERVSPYTVNWEGEMRTYAAGDPRLHGGNALILDDGAVNLWASTKDPQVSVRIDGKPATSGRFSSMTRRDNRNSTFSTGRLSLGDRHVVEVSGTEARLVAVDAKSAVSRRWVGVERSAWQRGAQKPAPFASRWGAPYGGNQLVIPAGGSAEIDLAGTDFSIAFAALADGGTLKLDVDGQEALSFPTNTPFVLADGSREFMEDRRGVRGLSYGMHALRVRAVDGPVGLLGVFSYDTRPNRTHERVERGSAEPGEEVVFTAPFRARPIVVCTGGLRVLSTDSHPDRIRFSGSTSGSYEIVGE